MTFHTTQHPTSCLRATQINDRYCSPMLGGAKAMSCRTWYTPSAAAATRFGAGDIPSHPPVATVGLWARKGIPARVAVAFARRYTTRWLLRDIPWLSLQRLAVARQQHYASGDGASLIRGSYSWLSRSLFRFNKNATSLN